MAPSRRKGASKAAAAAAARRQWKVGDLVLAKVKGFPAWPATVCDVTFIVDEIMSFAVDCVVFSCFCVCFCDFLSLHVILLWAFCFRFQILYGF